MTKKFSKIFSINVLCILFIGFFLSAQAQKKYTYETVPNDPLKARIYTLDNGLKVYMTVYKDEPRIFTFIATRAGSKNDPADATGLAHYFEHMMFKGTNNFGTLDFAKEKVLIDQIDSLFEVYRATKDPDRRTYLYHLIDSISYLASTYAIPNEYDKLVSIIGADATNAFTSVDQTTYVNAIPSNQLENWLTIEADRFNYPVLRLFHTELETVYEEKNMTLANDSRKVFTEINAQLFKKHPYGTQTTIGTIEHLKNPSMKKIREFFDTYYVPNNMAICMSGDLDPDKTIELIDKKFGSFKAKTLPKFTFEQEDPITEPIIKEVVGPDAESVTIGYRFGGATSPESEMMSVIDMILSNSAAGLIDLNLNQKQKLINGGSSPVINTDYSVLILSGKPKENQTLEEVKDLLLSQIELVKKGEFPDWLVPAIITNLKLNQIKRYESNAGRARTMLSSFVNGINWADEVNKFDRMSKITKADIVKFANQHFQNNYVVVYKRTGEDNSVEKIQKPKITTIKVNRDEQSEFLKKIESNKVKEIEPVFLDFSKDIKQIMLKNDVPIIYKQNVENPTFEMTYYFDMGNNNSKILNVALRYLEYLGTSKLSNEDIQTEFFKIGCSYSLRNTDENIYLSLNGLSENFEKALDLFENLIADAQPNEEALSNLKSDIIKKRKDAKLNKQVIMQALRNYAIYGPKSPFTYKLTDDETNALESKVLIDFIKNLFSYEHRILYYGTLTPDQLKVILEKKHKAPLKPSPLPPAEKFEQLPTTDKTIFHAEFPMKQVEITLINRSDMKYNLQLEPIVSLYNEYFGGSMNAIVFQELREARALAYTASSVYQIPNKKDRYFMNFAFIGTQTDKLMDAVDALFGLMNAMPESEKAFILARNSIVSRLRTERITKSDILFAYESEKKKGNNYDTRKDIFSKVPSFTFEDVKKFQEENIKGKPHHIVLLGTKKMLDFESLAKYGTIKYLTLEDIFGY